MLTPLDRVKAVLLQAPENSVAFNMAQELRVQFETGNGSINDTAIDTLIWLEEAVTRVLLPGIAGKTEDATTLIAEEVKPTSWLIENIWTDASRGFIAGHPGVGKTWLALEMLLSVASGRPFLGLYHVPTARNCLLVEEESSREALKHRLQMMTKEIPKGKLFTLTRQMVKIHKHIEELRAIIEKRKIELIVFDSFRRIHDAKESSSDEMALVLQSLSELQYESNINIVLIHHLKKSGIESKLGSIWEQLRGSSDLWAWRDCIIGMEATEDPFSAACQFQFRDAESGLPLLVRREIIEGRMILHGEKQEEWEEFKEECDTVKMLLTTSFEPLSATKIREKLKLRKGAVLAALRHLVSKNVVSKIGSGPNTKWSITIGTGTDREPMEPI